MVGPWTADTRVRYGCAPYTESLRHMLLLSGIPTSAQLYYPASLTAMGDGGADWVGVGVRNEQI